MEEASQVSPPHEHHQENWRRFKSFIERCPAQAFSDYPTRSFFRELFDDRPDDFFILTTRRNTNVWRRSMKGFFAKFKIDLDLDQLSQHYENGNEAIRELYTQSRNFLEICIDDDSVENSAKLARFLGFDGTVMLAIENQHKTLDNTLLSHRGDFYGQPLGHLVEHLKLACRGTKTMPSSSGWLYLINDSNNFIDYLYGRCEWSVEERERAIAILNERAQQIAAKGALYKKFIVPEKYVIYPEYLPSVLRSSKFAQSRPANDVTSCPAVIYLADYLLDAKSLGQLYFRTDTHTTWLGGFLIYRRIIEELLSCNLLADGHSLPLSSLTPSIAAFNGDLLKQMRKDHHKELADIWAPYFPANLHDHTVSYKLPVDRRTAQRVATPAEYEVICDSREVFVYEREGKPGPKAVIFRDSTADFVVELLAEHFARSVFVWKDGQVFEYILDREQPDVVLHLMAERFVSSYPTRQPMIRSCEGIHNLQAQSVLPVG